MVRIITTYACELVNVVRFLGVWYGDTSGSTQLIVESKLVTYTHMKENKLLGMFSGMKRTHIVVLFVLGVIVGGVIKWNVEPYVTMGYEDYKVEKNAQAFDYTEMPRELAEKAKSEAGGAGSAAAVPQGAACGV